MGKKDIYFEYPKIFVLKLIKLYQKTLSFDHGPLKSMFPGGFCRYNPSCSQYTYEAVAKYGVIKGGGKGLWRIMRCNPWAKGGDDPVK